MDQTVPFLHFTGRERLPQKEWGEPRAHSQLGTTWTEPGSPESQRSACPFSIHSFRSFLSISCEPGSEELMERWWTRPYLPAELHSHHHPRQHCWAAVFSLFPALTHVTDDMHTCDVP